MTRLLFFIKRFWMSGIIIRRKEALVTHKSRLAALGTAAALSSAVVLSSAIIAPTDSYAVIPTDGGAGSAETAKQKEAERKKAKKASKSKPVIRGRLRANEEAYERGKKEAARHNPAQHEFEITKQYQRSLARWTPRNETVMKKIIKDALNRHHGDVLAAYKDVDGQRHKPKNFFDQNLAIASDYLRARKDVRQGGADVCTAWGIESAAAKTYMAAKKVLGYKGTQRRPFRRGNGPVSPYSKLELKYMLKGANDGARDRGVRTHPPSKSPCIGGY